jgi:adenylate cyclase
MRRPVFTKKFPLRSSIVVLFALMTVPIFFAIVTLTYVSNEKIARANADAMIERFRDETVDRIESMFSPIKSLIRSAAMVGGQQPNFYTDDRAFKYLLSVLQHSDKLMSIYVGLGDGSFRQARRINPAVKIQNKLPPANAKYAYRWVEPARGASAVDRYQFLNEEHDPIGSSAAETTYDPRERVWYRQPADGGKLVITDPEVFAALGLIGFTVAAPINANGKIIGVAAADITLDGLSRFLAERKISPGTLSYILDAQGGVLANSALAKTYSNDGGEVALQHIASLGSRLAAIAYSSHPHDGAAAPYVVSHEGQDYLVSCSLLPVHFGKSWQLFTVTPLADFTAPFEGNNRLLFVWGLIAIAAEVMVIYFLSAMISAPLERLAADVVKIEHFEGELVPPRRSSIAEISVLAKAIDTLGATVQSFAAFVPVGLVRQLVNSEKRLELGGNSRFLTIFFSDLEGFSALSEVVPTRELMHQVSAYLALVTKAVNAEAGTIDKFIGDGVMAFWGAPALLDDHAWRACVAALRIQRGIDALNAGWRDEQRRPLRVRIGIHSDAVLVGNIGSLERMDYTVLGDGVNVASRLEGVNKEFGTRICISHAVFKEAGERLCVRPIDEVSVKGRRGKVAIYELLGAYGAELEPDVATQRLCRLTAEAHDALLREDLALARERYEAVLADFPDDPVAREMVRRVATIDASVAAVMQAAE